MKRLVLTLIAVVVLAMFAATCLLACAQIEMTPPPVSDNNDNGDNGNNGDSGEDGVVDDNGNNGDDNNGGDNDDNGDNNDNNDNNDDDNNNNNGNNGDDNSDNGDDVSTVPTNTKTTVYYTNSGRWNNVYAYCWNYSSNKYKTKWPGERLTSFGSSGYGEKQYKMDVDYSVYDRIIFNDGRDGGAKTKDLVVSGATSGYYGEDGVFTMGTENYGAVTEKTFTDTENLNYIGNKSKKVWIYTPPNYSTAKKYGVLYMFDGQNLFGAASGVAESSNSWCVDVAVTSLVKNGGEGIIVVGIDNGSGGSDRRDQELTMSLNFGTLTSLGDPQYGSFRNGKLDELGNFIKQTLMPWVKSNYSVDASRGKTGIAGSSSGGLAAYYLGLRDNDLYGYIGAFSPANGLFGSSDWTRFYNGKNGFAGGKPKVYVYCGRNKDDLFENMLLPETKKIKSGLTACGFAAANITENYVDGGAHNEAYWRLAFPEFLSKTAL